VLIVNKEFLQMYIYVYLNVILKKVCTYLNGDQFFFTFPTSEGSDLLSSHVMQTPTFISKLSDGNVIFRLIFFFALSSIANDSQLFFFKWIHVVF
jgi:hypothetical protein